MLDMLCLTGEIGWARLSAPRLDPATPLRLVRATPVALFLREHGPTWQSLRDCGEPVNREAGLGPGARRVLDALRARGASFFNDLAKTTHRLASEVEDALWELVTAGLVTADGFENLRALLDPKRRRGEGRGRTARPRHAPGRWALLRHTGAPPENHAELFARQLLGRWGVVFRDAAMREPIAPPWRELLPVLRRLESRGEIRGGRFLAAFVGEQFALPEALDLLRAIRRTGETAAESEAFPVLLPAAS